MAARRKKTAANRLAALCCIHSGYLADEFGLGVV
jgi:hypothetical protein